MSSINLGRVQGGGFFGSTSTSETVIDKSTVFNTSVIAPLVGDTIVNAAGALCQIKSIGTTTYAVEKYGSIKGADSNGGMSAFAFIADTAEYASGYTKGGEIDRAFKKIIKRLETLEAGGN